MARSAARSTVAACPCGSGASYSRCCAPLHRGTAVAGTAEQLMRSRYCAYAKGLDAYLLRTWDPSTRPVELQLDDGLRWTGLEVVRSAGGGELDQVGTVEFIARHDVAGVTGALHEVSRFRRLGDDWVYVDGEH